MVKWLILGIIFIMLILVAFGWQVHEKQRQLKLDQKGSQHITDQAFAYAIKHVDLLKKDHSKLKIISTLVSNVWGDKVTAFEYAIPAKNIKVKELERLKQELTTELQRYVKYHHLVSFNDHPVFVISDIWMFANELHVDISHITNAETWAYIQDVNKSDKKR